ncbi:MAG: rRNA pseudouridine synthase [Deltaproteobacteria bacterium]|nr:rRNA pseudouridine synthase [Deltaproteobacteria bacterium]
MKGQISADPIRLHKALARAGIASRRKAEEMIVEGRVLVNRRPVDQLGMKINPDSDTIHVDGHKISVPSESHHDKIYLLLHKPPSVLTTTSDDRGRPTVMDLVAGTSGTRIFPVGRLDFDSEGALLLTNDGDLAHALTHPKFHVAKTYAAKVKGTPKEADLDKLRRGLYLDDGPTRPAHVEVLGKARVNTWVEITITEGRNRLVKRMFWRIRHPVMKLVRTEFAGLTLDGLTGGKSRMLTKHEVARLKDLVRF